MEIGSGYRASLDSLTLRVALYDGGWGYEVQDTRTGKMLRSLIPCGQSEYMEPENCKFKAIQEALHELGRSDDPHSILRILEWKQYGP